MPDILLGTRPKGRFLRNRGMAHLGAHIDTEGLGHAAIDLEHIDNVIAAARDRGAIHRNGVLVNVEDLPGLIHENHVEGDQRILHPEADVLRSVINEEHSGQSRHLGHVHQPAGTFLHIIGNLDPESRRAPIAPQLHPVFTAPRLCRHGENHRRGQCRRKCHYSGWSVMHQNRPHLVTVAAPSPRRRREVPRSRPRSALRQPSCRADPRPPSWQSPRPAATP
mmetsp:Transcript_780/g.1403  ORF Transcript_780/g.1403 Transcript_780/m.1403 type:complete len:222 (-) Transcript_780:683-1348(-)